MPNPNRKVSIILACHNRVRKTLLCLESLAASFPEGWSREVILVDDGSTDGTADQVRRLFPETIIITGTGNWFWAKSMYEAQNKVSKDSDYLIMLNDDVELFHSAFSRVELLAKQYPEDVLVGQFKSRTDERLSYGVLRQVGRHPLKYAMISNLESTTEIDVFHGNFVFIPKRVVEKVGLIDGAFEHAYADFDYALRIRNFGFKIRSVPGFIGYCEPHNLEWPTNVYDRLTLVFSKKGLPWRSQLRYLRKYGPIEWPLYFLAPYIRAILAIRGKSDIH